MNITNEIKVKVFAQYLGQETIYDFDGKPFRGMKKIESLTLQNIELLAFSTHRKLVLKPLNKITAALSPEDFAKQYPNYTDFIYTSYLQSLGYDLPNYLLGGKTLFESKLAIYENK